MWFDHDGLIYVFGHRQSTRFNRHSRIRVINGAWALREMYIGRCCHNVYMEHGSLYTCDSANWAFVEVNGWTGDRHSVDLNGFTRGLARVPGGFVVGVSDDTPRESRKSGDSRLVLLDDRLRIVDAVEMRGFGGVEDLRALGVSDPSHNGIVFP